MRNSVYLAALAASAAVATPAFAQAFPNDDAPAVARGVVLQTHSLINQTDLDFGIVTTDGTNPGTVTIAPDSSGARGFTGGVVLLPSNPTSARFDGRGAPLETVVLTLTRPVSNVLQSTSNASDTIAVNSMSIDGVGLTETITVPATGDFTVYVGGDFGLSATQPSGVYTGDFNLNAEFQ